MGKELRYDTLLPRFCQDLVSWGQYHTVGDEMFESPVILSFLLWGRDELFNRILNVWNHKNVLSFSYNQKIKMNIIVMKIVNNDGSKRADTCF